MDLIKERLILSEADLGRSVTKDRVWSIAAHRKAGLQPPTLWPFKSTI